MIQVSKNTDLPVIHKILVAVDGSETSSKAAENASELAEKYGADLIALHIVPPNIKSSEIFDLAKQYGQKIVVLLVPIPKPMLLLFPLLLVRSLTGKPTI